METRERSKDSLRTRDDAVWATDLSARLRALQASFADDAPEERQRYLADEVAHALQEVAPTERRARLESLSELFPIWDAPVGTGDAESGAAVAAPVPRPVEEDSPEELVRRLVALSPELSQPGRATLARQLASAGYQIPAADGAAPAAASANMTDAEIPAELQKRLGLEPGQPLDHERVLRLVAILVEFAVTLDHLGWGVWKNIAPSSPVRRDPGPAGDLRKLAGPYLLGDSEVSTTQITQAVDKARQLVAGLIAAIGATGETFARQFLTRFSPVEIKAAADAEAGFFLGPEQKCWRRYTALFDETSGVAIEQEISKIVATYAENLITGAGRSKS